MLIIKRGRNTSYRLLCATVNNNKKIKRYCCKDPDIQCLLIKESFKTRLILGDNKSWHDQLQIHRCETTLFSLTWTLNYIRFFKVLHSHDCFPVLWPTIHTNVMKSINTILVLKDQRCQRTARAGFHSIRDQYQIKELKTQLQVVRYNHCSLEEQCSEIRKTCSLIFRDSQNPIKRLTLCLHSHPL